ncbi:hypothetical protein CL620_05755 [archaeon]|nr:hypothetical protein [archaeon]|tara:strand:- start:573 stop:908 length:336 start_codon:yes stop_codon:yes gene_type:complete
MEKCDECKTGTIQNKEVEYILLGKNLGQYPAMVCNSCGQTLYTADVLDQVEAKARKLGIWGLAAKTRIGTSGNALDVKLPKAITNFLKLEKGQEVLIEPVDEKRFQVAIIR